MLVKVLVRRPDWLPCMGFRAEPGASPDAETVMPEASLLVGAALGSISGFDPVQLGTGPC